MGDDGLSETPSNGQLNRETDNLFSMWSVVSLLSLFILFLLYLLSLILYIVVSLLNRLFSPQVFWSSWCLWLYGTHQNDKEARSRVQDLGNIQQELRQSHTHGLLNLSISIFCQFRLPSYFC